jgi:tetrahydromethanopterin S-methyltransferase subunit C
MQAIIAGIIIAIVVGVVVPRINRKIDKFFNEKE